MYFLRILFAAVMCMSVMSCAYAGGKEEISIKSSGIGRTVSWMSDLLRTSKIESDGKSVLAGPGVEFMLEFQYKDEWIWMTPKDFKMMGVNTGEGIRENQTVISMQCLYKGLPFVLHITYYSHPELMTCIQKSVTMEPYKDANEIILRRVVIEDCELQSNYSPVMPVDRYAGNSGDNPKADLSDIKQRFRFDSDSNYTAIDVKSNKGLFFFTSSLFGRESCSTRRRLTMSEECYVPLSQGYQTGRATIGAVSGPPEVLFKRFREFLWTNYCVMRGKKSIVVGGTSMSDKENVSEEKCLAALKTMKEEGYFTTFHLGYGWENHYPLTDDKEKFPQGLPWLSQQAKDMGFNVAYWINPLGSKGQTTDKPDRGGQWDGLMKDHPEWFATYDTAENPNPKGNDILCFTTPYMDYVEEKLTRLVKECGAAMFYNDGNDWNSFKCPPSGQYHMSSAELNYTVPKRLAAMYDNLRKVNPQLVVCLSPQVGNAPSHAHRLNTIDQIEFWNGTDNDCLGGRQQRYNQMFIYPSPTMHSGWYTTDMSTPFSQQKYAILSALPGFPQNQGTQQIVKPNPELSAYLKKAFAFRKKHESYFEVYQHVLDFPDGMSVDGEGHIINGKGFIMLFNPSDQTQKVTLPLDEPGLELKGTVKLSDWTELDAGVDMGTASVSDKVEVELGPVSAKIIGVNINGQ